MPALTRDPAVTEATIVALTASRLPGSGFTIAADVRRFAGWDFYRVSTLHCEVPGGAHEHRLIHGSGLRPEQIRGRTPSAVALKYLDAHLARPPYLLLAHQAGPLVSLIAQYGEHCPALAAAAILDTAELVRQVRGTPASVPLDAYAEQFQIPRSSLTPVTARAALTARVFTSLARQEQANADLAGVLARCVPERRFELTAGGMNALSGAGALGVRPGHSRRNP